MSAYSKEEVKRHSSLATVLFHLLLAVDVNKTYVHQEALHKKRLLCGRCKNLRAEELTRMTSDSYIKAYKVNFNLLYNGKLDKPSHVLISAIILGKPR